MKDCVNVPCSRYSELHWNQPALHDTKQLESSSEAVASRFRSVNAGKRHVRLLPDGWTVVTRDHALSAQWEHTILITDDGYEVLTLGADQRK